MKEILKKVFLFRIKFYICLSITTKQSKNLKKMKNYSTLEKANYIVKMIKSVNKSLDYAIEYSAWYTMTNEEQLAVENEIKKLW